MRHYVIIGAGISGLALGWFLKQNQPKDVQITILEAGKRVGGWIETRIEEGFLFEQGPRSFRPEGTGIATLQLIEKLGLQEHVIFAGKTAKKRYLYTDQRLFCVPTGPLSLLSSPFNYKILKAIWNDWFAKKGAHEDESIYSFVNRRFGHAISELFFDPLMSGIYAGDIKQLSIKSCLPFLQTLEQQHGSILRGGLKKRNNKSAPAHSHSSFVEEARRQGLFTLKEGVQTLVDALAKALADSIELECPVKKLTFASDLIQVELMDGPSITPDKLFIAIPPKQLLGLVATDYPQMKVPLNSVPTTSIAVMNFGFRTSVLKQEGFGYLIPSREKQKLLGAVWDSSAFPQQNSHPEQTRLTAMLGGVHCVDFDSYSENDLIEMALKELREHLGIKQRPDYIAVKRACHAIPQYVVGHHAAVEGIEAAFEALSPHVKLLGNGFHGISVNDCIAKAKLVSMS